MANSSKMIIYLDNLQRLIMAELVTEVETSLQTTIQVKNPVIINIQSQGTQINVQFFPIVMREMLADGDSATVWTINKASITRCENVVLNARLIAQYQQICSPMGPSMPRTPQLPQLPPPTPPNTNSVIKLFDD